VDRSSTSQLDQTATTQDCSGGFSVDNHVQVDWVVPGESQIHKSVNFLVRPSLRRKDAGTEAWGDIHYREELLPNRRRREEGGDQEGDLRDGSSREALMMRSLELVSFCLVVDSVTFTWCV
jgi:hypothetical protein